MSKKATTFRVYSRNAKASKAKASKAKAATDNISCAKAKKSDFQADISASSAHAENTNHHYRSSAPDHSTNEKNLKEDSECLRTDQGNTFAGHDQAGRKSTETVPDLEYPFEEFSENSLRGIYKIKDLTVQFETRQRYLPLDPSQSYSLDFLHEYEERAFFAYSTVSIRNKDGDVYQLYMPVAEEAGPGFYRHKYTDGELLGLYERTGFVEVVKQVIEEWLYRSNPPAKVTELPDEMIKKPKKIRRRNYYRDIDPKNILTEAAEVKGRFTRSMAKSY